jgi:hypothetical protein
MYTIASSGATIHFHYCMGKFMGWDVASNATQKCSNCGMTKENKKGCCNDKQKTFQLKKDQLASPINYVSNTVYVFTNHEHSFLIKYFAVDTDQPINATNSPPLIEPVSALILNCVFRI